MAKQQKAAPQLKAASSTRLAVDIGIPAGDRQAIAEGLNALLADTYALYQKTHAFHWNVEGPMFQTLHLMFEGHYNELWLATDLVAERIRALGFPVRATYSELSKLSSIAETPGVPEATAMVKLLVQGHEAAAKTARKVFGKAEAGGDESTVDLLTQRLQVHEKTAWMLRSLLA
jgi:starvation-inducible DNA-binding protein